MAHGLKQDKLKTGSSTSTRLSASPSAKPTTAAPPRSCDDAVKSLLIYSFCQPDRRRESAHSLARRSFHTSSSRQRGPAIINRSPSAPEDSFTIVDWKTWEVFGEGNNARPQSV